MPESEPLDAGQSATAANPNDAARKTRARTPSSNVPVDANGNPIPLERQQPQRILGFMPNFRSVSGGAKPHPPGWKYNFTVATHQATDYSSFIFLGLTSLTAEGMDEHPGLGKGVGGFYAYTWRGFLDKTDNTYLSAWLSAFALPRGHALLRARQRAQHPDSRALRDQPPGRGQDLRRPPDA